MGDLHGHSMLWSLDFILKDTGTIKGFQQGNHLMRFMLWSSVEDGMLGAAQSSWDTVCGCVMIPARNDHGLGWSVQDAKKQTDHGVTTDRFE